MSVSPHTSLPRPPVVPLGSHLEGESLDHSAGFSIHPLSSRQDQVWYHENLDDKTCPGAYITIKIMMRLDSNIMTVHTNPLLVPKNEVQSWGRRGGGKSLKYYG